MDRELLLLGLLRRQDMHGYQLAEFINRDLTSCTDLKKSTAYYLLDKMAQKGWVSTSQAQEGNRPTRTVYTITAAGEAAFQRLLRENLAAHHAVTFTGDIGLAFADALAPDEVRALLASRRAALVEKLAEARAVPVHSGLLQLVIEHQVRHLAAELSWLDEVMTHFTALATQAVHSD